MPAAPDLSAPVTVRAALALASGRLARAGILDAEVDAQLLLAHVLRVGRGEVQAAAIRGDVLGEAESAELAHLVERRATREPLQHLTGRAPFRHLELRVGPGVFVPRPETEMLAQIAIDALMAVAAPAPVAVDLGTGSGAVGLSIATEVPHARVIAVENAVDAFIWAKENFAEVAADNARVVFDDLDTALTHLDGTVSVVASNPPYVPNAAIPRDPEVRWFDPPSALYGGSDGLDVVRRVSSTAWRLAHRGGVLAIEHGELQGADIRGLLTADGWRAVATHQDLTMRDRVTTAVRP
ncbi:peptide chain release factor N(5)-glutamine methyltransferase [Microbacterium sediminicola]|uniref:Release factor glutamine methyltransferase n=1 Tax=Microbacterium sediminicola TaxID=415210 RepID=A0ABN2HLN4_9MICO